jgi:hypothetical protein
MADERSIGGECDTEMTRRKVIAGGPNDIGWARSGGFVGVLAKKKPADESGLKTIFLEENSGDRRDYAAPPHICPMVKLDTSHIIS